MTRQILSMSSTYDAYNVPNIGLSRERPIVGIETTYVSAFDYDKDGNLLGETIIEGERIIFDEDWVQEEEFIYLTVIDDRKYFSIHEDYTMEILEKEFKDFYDDPDTPDIDESLFFQLKLETEDVINSEFTIKVLENNSQILNKYREDETYLEYLGLQYPEYQPLSFNPEGPGNIIYPEDAFPEVITEPEPEPEPNVGISST